MRFEGYVDERDLHTLLDKLERRSAQRPPNKFISDEKSEVNEFLMYTRRQTPSAASAACQLATTYSTPPTTATPHPFFTDNNISLYRITNQLLL